MIEEKAAYLKFKYGRDSLKQYFKIKYDKYLDDILKLEEKVKDHERIVFKMSHSVQTIHMLNTTLNSFYDPNFKTGLGYRNLFRLRDLEVAFGSDTCYDWNLEGDDLLSDHATRIFTPSPFLTWLLHLPDERRDEKKRLNHLKQDQTILAIKRFSERKKVFRERKKTGKIRAKKCVFLPEIVQYL
nr:hypothetical protein [Tanacetum cinerariifolium]